MTASGHVLAKKVDEQIPSIKNFHMKHDIFEVCLHSYIDVSNSFINSFNPRIEYFRKISIYLKNHLMNV